MKYPVIYIKGRGNHLAHFRSLVDGKMSVVADISSAMQAFYVLKSPHAFLFYEQRKSAIDFQNIHFLRSKLASCGIILITDSLDSADRKGYLNAGVNSAVAGNVGKEQLEQTLRFISDYSFTHKPIIRQTTEIHVFKMPLWKRLFDITASATALLLLSPVFLAAAAAISFDSRGPVIYKSKRVGSNYKVFDFLKFRSMRTNADKQLKRYNDLNQYTSAVEVKQEASTPISISDGDISEILSRVEEGMLVADDFMIEEQTLHQQIDTEQESAFVKIENDPRVTPVGRFIRKYSIDELPQLINILRGDMSVVGNRPLPLYEAEMLTSDEYIERFMCPSGLTGLWQVEKRGCGGRLSPEQRKQLDIQYAKKMSPWLDLKIILRTFTAFIQKENV